MNIRILLLLLITCHLDSINADYKDFKPYIKRPTYNKSVFLKNFKSLKIDHEQQLLYLLTLFFKIQSIHAIDKHFKINLSEIICDMITCLHKTLDDQYILHSKVNHEALSKIKSNNLFIYNILSTCAKNPHTLSHDEIISRLLDNLHFLSEKISEDEFKEYVHFFFQQIAHLCKKIDTLTYPYEKDEENN